MDTHPQPSNAVVEVDISSAAGLTVRPQELTLRVSRSARCNGHDLYQWTIRQRTQRVSKYHVSVVNAR